MQSIELSQNTTMQKDLTTGQRLKRMLKKAKSSAKPDECTDYNEKAKLSKFFGRPPNTSSKPSHNTLSDRNEPVHKIPRKPVPTRPVAQVYSSTSSTRNPVPTKQMVQTASSSTSLQSILLKANGKSSATSSQTSLSSAKVRFAISPHPRHAIDPSATRSMWTTPEQLNKMISHWLDPAEPAQPPIEFEHVCPVAYHYLQGVRNGDGMNDGLVFSLPKLHTQAQVDM